MSKVKRPFCSGVSPKLNVAYLAENYDVGVKHTLPIIMSFSRYLALSRNETNDFETQTGRFGYRTHVLHSRISSDFE